MSGEEGGAPARSSAAATTTAPVITPIDREPINAEDQQAYDAQQQQPIAMLRAQGAMYKTVPGKALESGYLAFLGANEVFFHNLDYRETQKMSNKQDGTSDDELNNNINFSGTKNMKKSGDEAEGLYWGFILKQARTDSVIRVFFKVKTTNSNVGGTVNLIVDGTAVSATLETQGGLIYQLCHEISGLKSGYHTLELRSLVPAVEDATVGNVSYAMLVSDAPIHVVRERWRPLAAHHELYASQADNIDGWAYELEQESTEVSFAPIGTPFGYFGPIFDATGTSTGVNFSLWSYSADDPVPPRSQWARILAIGDADAEFGEFSHEGTGVKIDDFNPWRGNLSRKYVVALRVESDPRNSSTDGKLYTYYSYYWDEVTGDFKLYGVGEAYSATELSTLHMEPFIEVIGSAGRVRSNQSQRKLFYTGYAHGVDQTDWVPIDRMKPVIIPVNSGGADPDSGDPNPDDYTNKEWGVSRHRFFAGCGGLQQRLVSEIAQEFSTNAQDPPPAWVEKLDTLADIIVPFPTILRTRVTMGPSGEPLLRLDVDINPLISDGALTIFLGTDDGLTTKSLWTLRSGPYAVHSGENEIEITVNKQLKYVRALISNDSMQVWSRQSVQFYGEAAPVDTD